jgi:hypothetical protein
MQKVKNIYLLEPGEEFSKDAINYGATGLVFEMEDGSIVTHHTMDSLQPFAKQDKIDSLGRLIIKVHKDSGGIVS